jgi:uncharacterized membrane protein YhaH (DUF805 family)
MSTAMTPVDWAKRPIEKYADFSGRAPRAEYWWYFLAVIVASLIAQIIDSMLGLALFGPYGPLLILLSLGLLVPGLAVTVRRLHDTGRSGWWILIALIPYFLVGVMMGMAAASGSMAGLAGVGLFAIVALAGAIALLVFMILPGIPGDNRFGPDPYGTEGAAAGV